MLKQILSTILLFVSMAVTAQPVKEPTPMSDEWEKEYQPFRIAGNLYYVGTYDLACYLVATPKGHILINTGLASSASQIKKHVEALGFKFSDIKILTTTQAHHDHLGAMAAIKKMTKAKLWVDEKDAEVMATGGKTDYAFGGDTATFAPVKADRLLKDRDSITLGGTSLVLLHHPGHTKGSCSFLVTVKDEQQSWKVLIANLPSIVVSQKFPELTTYPTISDDYAYTLNAMKNISFDLWMASHASQFNLHEKRKPGDAYNPQAFADKAGYDKALSQLQKAYDEKVKQ